jgi:hypothetical protein
MNNKKKTSTKTSKVDVPPKPPVDPKPKYPIQVPPKPPVDTDPYPDDKQGKTWALSIGLYPGILFGIRTYEEANFKTHVLYLPFVDFALEIDN